MVFESYDAVRELIEAKMALSGYKSYSHEATILFLKKFNNFNEREILFLDDLRKTRNRIKYYSKEIDKEGALKVISFMDSISPKLKEILNKEINEN